MATYDVNGTHTMQWSSVQGVYIGTRTNIKSVTDEQTDSEWKVGEAVKMEFTSGTKLDGHYRGTYTYEGKEYPIIELTSGDFFVLGSGVPSPTPTGLIRTVSSGVTTWRSEVDTTKDFTVCFFPGTLIATPSGERKVEDLAPGDLVLVERAGSVPATWIGRIARKFSSSLGFGRAVPVKWLGRQTVSTRFGPADRLMPVRFAAGSLGGGGQTLLPHRDLTVTADHAMLVDGVLCEAGALVNGTTITRVPLSEFGECYTVYHIETENHEIILANGVPAETFVDNVSRRAFDNYAEFAELYGDQPEMKELPYPRASNVRHLPARIRGRLGMGAATDSAKIA